MQNERGPTFILGHSPDPDDAFMFYAMAAGKIDLRGYRFLHQLEDIQTLNERALRGELHISAVSIYAYAFITDKYALLPSGASMGDGYGPLVISRAGHRPPHAEPADWLRDKQIAIPGEMTSAFLALQLYLGRCHYVVVPFDKIFQAVAAGKADAGLVIHEGQLTYARDGFEKIVDLGEWWKAQTGLPLPLGGNVLRKDISAPVQRELAAVLRDSIEFGLSHRAEAVRHAVAYARNMDDSLTSKFVGMYVNEYTRDYGAEGREAIRRFLGQAHERGLLPRKPLVEFAT